jgi:alpha-1,6-mannosyltransferase
MPTSGKKASMAELVNVVRDWTRSHYPREIVALVPLGATGCSILVLIAVGPWVNGKFGYPGLVPLLIGTGLATVVATKMARTTSTRGGLSLVLVLAFAMRLSMVSINPILSTDVYRYVWDGRVQAAGINPYRFVPADSALSALRDASIFPNINRANSAVTIYPPVAQAFFYLATRLGETITVMRLALVACELVTIGIIIDLLRRFGRPVTTVVAYAWHPLPIWEIANNGHVDALMVALGMTGLWLLIRMRPLASAIAVALGVLVKPYLILILPAMWRPWDWRVPLAVILTIGIWYVPYLGVGTGVLGYLGTGYLDEEDFADGDGFWLVHLANSAWGEFSSFFVFYLCVTLTVLGYLAIRAAWRSDRSPETTIHRMIDLLLAGLFFLSPNYPWYFLVLTPFLSIAGGAPAWTFTIGAFLLYQECWCDDQPDILIWKTALNVAFLIAVTFAFAKNLPVPGRLREILGWQHRANGIK